MDAAWKPSTKKSYTSAQRKYIRFCEDNDFYVLPASENVILLYIAHLKKEKLQGQSIRCYLSALRQLHIINRYPEPKRTPRISAVLSGCLTLSNPPSRKSPITYDILSSILDIISVRSDYIMLKAVMCSLFFGCLRAGELCVPDGVEFDSKKHVCIEDIQINKKQNFFKLFLKQSKTDRFSNGVNVYIGCSGTVTCAYCSLLDYLESRPSWKLQEPLFQITKGLPLRKNYLINATKLALSGLGMNPKLFGGHSYRCGSATSASKKKFNEWELKLLGRWRSSVYTTYLRKPELVATFAKNLVHK